MEYQECLAQVEWDDYVVEGDEADEIGRGKVSRIGRVVEKTCISNATLILGVVACLAVLRGICCVAACLCFLGLECADVGSKCGSN